MWDELEEEEEQELWDNRDRQAWLQKDLHKVKMCEEEYE